MTFKITKLYEKKPSGLDFLLHGEMAFLARFATRAQLPHSQPGGLVTIGGLNGGKRPKELLSSR